MQMIQKIGENLQIEFQNFGENFAEKYDLFLRVKSLPESNLSYDYEKDSYLIETHARYANLLGISEQVAAGCGLDLPEFVARLIENEAGEGLQVLVWTIFDAETDIIADLLCEKSKRRADLEKRLNFAKSDYHKTERQMFDEIPSGEINPKYKLAAKEFAARKKELEHVLDSFSEEITKVESELDDLKLQANGGGEFIRGKDFEILSGATPKLKRAEILERFRKGDLPVLISKASLLGYGMNFQSCGSMIFSGWNDSFESFYQAVGRAVRYGQEKSVRIHLPFIRELEYEQLENIFRKAALFEAAILEQEKAYIKAMKNLKLL